MIRRRRTRRRSTGPPVYDSSGKRRELNLKRSRAAKKAATKRKGRKMSPATKRKISKALSKK